MKAIQKAEEEKRRGKQKQEGMFGKLKKSLSRGSSSGQLNIEQAAEEAEAEREEEEEEEEEEEIGGTGHEVNEGEEGEMELEKRIADDDSEVDISQLNLSIKGFLAGAIADGMHAIAKCYLELHDFANSKFYIDRAICMREEVFGSSSAQLGESLHLFGLFYVTQNRQIDALKCFRRALRVREQACGHQHEDVADTCIQLGEVLADLEQVDDAGIFLTRGCVVREAIHGEDDPLSKRIREKWRALRATAMYYDPVDAGEAVPHFSRRSPESFLHGFRSRQKTGLVPDTMGKPHAPEGQLPPQLQDDADGEGLSPRLGAGSPRYSQHEVMMGRPGRASVSSAQGL